MEKIADGFKGEKAIITPYNIRQLQTQNPICSQLFLTHIGYYPKAKFHFRERIEGNKEYILLYCEKGSGWVEYQLERYLLKENQVFIIPPSQAHAYGADPKDPWSIYWLHFRGDNAAMFDSIMGKIMDIEDSDKGRHKDRFLLFEEMYQNLSMGYSPENLEYISFCLMHFLASIKYLNQFREIKKVKESDIIQKSIVYMKEHLETKTSLEDIAQHVSYSTSHFCSLFTQRTSYSPVEYYHQLKIQRACSYLQFSDLKIKEIAFRLCYFDPFHFSKAFRQEMEISPSEYRQRYRNG
ncbi:AraC family transcriptional regulator [Bacteroidales bacterium]|nr:AraC family transcriptional regulator [Bacteroidales bacterium]